MKDTRNNRPRVEWKDGKMVSADGIKKTNVAPKTSRANTDRKLKTKRTAVKEKPVRESYDSEVSNEKESDVLDFFLSLRYKRHIVVAFFIILALSVTIAAVAVSMADGEPLVSPVDVEVTEADTQTTDTSDITVTEEATEEATSNIAVQVVETPEHTGHGHAVCIDPGHGYDDEGTSNAELGVYEKDVVLRVALKLQEKLEDAGIKVYMTHDTNTPPTETSGMYLFGMKKRTSFANSLSDVSLYISIHCDAFYDDPSVYGSRIYHMSDEPDSEGVAKAISAALVNAGSDKTPIIKPMSGMNSYQVLRDTNMAAVLVETGFVSNEDEANRMLTDEWVDYMAGALAAAIEESFENDVI